MVKVYEFERSVEEGYFIVSEVPPYSMTAFVSKADYEKLEQENTQLKEQNRSALTDRAQVIKQLQSVRSAKRTLADECEGLEAAVDIQNQELKSLAEAIHYPSCWDIAAYPTLLSALSEIGCNPDNCQMRGAGE